MSKLAQLTALAAGILLIGGCGGQIAKTGCATVTGVNGHGVMGMAYSDGKVAYKRVDPDNPRKASRIAQENLMKPARYVETGQGSTLTFPDGETINYFDMPCD